MTLFAAGAESSDDAADFDAVLAKLYGGEPDPLTRGMLTQER